MVKYNWLLLKWKCQMYYLFYLTLYFLSLKDTSMDGKPLIKGVILLKIKENLTLFQ